MKHPLLPQALLSSIPDWVQWIAQDEDGTWWGYKAEPLERDHGWYENEIGLYIKLMEDTPNPDWHKTLVKK